MTAPRRSASRSARAPYALDQCALFQVRSCRRLFRLLQTSEGGVARLLADPERYKRKLLPKKDGSHREIMRPSYGLKRVQGRIAELLARVTTPAYLFAPVRGRSYIDNAARHRDATAFRLLDVEDFFPNCSVNMVARFFHRTLDCSRDVAAVLTKLTTHNGTLPQGSPASSALAFWAYKEMWDEIDERARASNVTLSVYADDISLSGRTVPTELVHDVQRCLKKHGHAYNPAKEVSVLNAPVLVTGVIVRDGSLLLPNVQHLRTVRTRRAISKAPSGERQKLELSLAGRRVQTRQIEMANESVVI